MGGAECGRLPSVVNGVMTRQQAGEEIPKLPHQKERAEGIGCGSTGLVIWHC